jgi:hypothetical protein
MSARIVWNGLEELKEQLRNLPTELTAEAGHIVEGAANAAAADVKAAYPVRTGNLRDHVFVSHRDKGRFSAGAVVKNTAKHAWIFENGTQARHNSIGANRGSMPPGNVFIPAMIKRRRVMYQQLKTVLERHGLRVSGDAG